MSSASNSPVFECKPKACFSDLPWFLKQRIVDNTDLITRLRLRKVSKDVIYYVDKSSFNIKMLAIVMLADIAVIKIITEEAPKEKRMRVFRQPRDCSERSHVKRAVRALAPLFRNSRTIIKDLAIIYNILSEPYLNGSEYPIDHANFHLALNEELDKLPHKLNVTRLSTTGRDKEDSVLLERHLKPEVLKEMFQVISVDKDIQEKIYLTRESETEPWKPKRF